VAKDEGYYGPMVDDYEKRIAELEAALRDIIPMAAIFADSYARNYEVPGGVLHTNHSEILDRASVLIGDGPISAKLKRK
jgi:hypothetical protein